MKIEIIEFYGLDRNEEKGLLNGTLRIKLSEIGIHILGIYVTKKKESWFFHMPGRLGTNHETGEAVRYPFIVFEDREKQKELMTAIREKGREFIEKRLTDTENPIIWPQKQKKEQYIKKLSSTKDNAMEAKQIGKEAAKPTISTIKVWQDPPPRKNTRKTCAYGKYR